MQRLLMSDLIHKVKYADRFTTKTSEWAILELDVDMLNAEKRWRVITEPQHRSSDLNGWRDWLESRGHETKKTHLAKGWVLRARKI